MSWAFEKVMSPGATEDWDFDWESKWLASGEAITAHTITVHNVTLDSSTEAAGIVTAWITAPDDPESQGIVICEITTDGGRTTSRGLLLEIQRQ